MSSLKQLEEPLLPNREKDVTSSNGSKGLLIMVAGITFQTIGYIFGKFIYQINN